MVIIRNITPQHYEAFDAKYFSMFFNFSIPFHFPANFAQIPNAGFKQWPAGNPDVFFFSNRPGLRAPVTRTFPDNSGASAVKGAAVTSSFGDTVLPLLAPGKFKAARRMILPK